MKTAFIILTYNRPDTLLEVLRGLASQCGANNEVIIADDGSAPACVETLYKGLPKFNCPVQHVWHPDTGFTIARARNLAAAISTSDYFVFMDGDCIPNPCFVKAHLALMEPGFFVNGSRVLLSQKLSAAILLNEVDISKARFIDWLHWRLAGDSNKLIHLLRWSSNIFRKEKLFRWKKIRGCNLSVWRKDFLLVNGFDQSFKGWGHEDADFVLRLHNAGLQRKNGFCASEVYHLWHPENSRSSDMINRDIVRQRMHTGVIRATQGVDSVNLLMDARVTRIN